MNGLTRHFNMTPNRGIKSVSELNNETENTREMVGVIAFSSVMILCTSISAGITKNPLAYVIAGIVLTMGMIMTITVTISYQQKKSFHGIDSLTGVYSRQKLDIDLETCYVSEEKLQFNLTFIDIDDFKKINDKQGHLIGDQMLVQFAHALKQSFPYTYRYGGDEFVLISDGKKEDTEDMLQRLSDDFPYPHFSFGISQFPNDVMEYDTLHHFIEKMIRIADERMYSKKKN